MEQSPTIAKLADALRKFQVDMRAVERTADNPFFKSKYAPLEDIIEAIKQPLSNEGLSFSQFPEGDGLTTVLMHESGEWMRATMRIHMGTKPQEHGSSITYARRYALSAVLGLATEPDDDGNVASQTRPAPVKASVAVKTGPRSDDQTVKVQAAKDRIMAGLRALKMVIGPKPSADDCIKAVRIAVDMDLTDGSLTNLEAIGEALWAIVEQRDAQN